MNSQLKILNNKNRSDRDTKHIEADKKAANDMIMHLMAKVSIKNNDRVMYG